MASVTYLTPEYMETVTNAFQDPELKKALEKLTTRLAWRVKADPAWGIDEDLFFYTEITNGVTAPFRFVSEEEAKKNAEFFMVGKPEVWKKIDTGKADFATQLVMQKVKLAKGSMMQMMKLAPYSKPMNKVMLTLDIKYQDDMAPEEVESFRKYLKEFRSKASA
jgi:putative sterol carrier protein